jgi:hypothetical protein
VTSSRKLTNGLRAFKLVIRKLTDCLFTFKSPIDSTVYIKSSLSLYCAVDVVPRGFFSSSWLLGVPSFKVKIKRKLSSCFFRTGNDVKEIRKTTSLKIMKYCETAFMFHLLYLHLTIIIKRCNENKGSDGLFLLFFSMRFVYSLCSVNFRLVKEHICFPLYFSKMGLRNGVTICLAILEFVTAESKRLIILE